VSRESLVTPMSEGRIFQTTDALPNGFFEVDGQGLIRIWNQWLEERTGRPRVEILGRRVNETYPEAFKLHKAIEHVRATFQPVLRSQLLHQYLLPIPLATGHFSGFAWMQQECHIIPIKSGEGSLAITIRDVTSVVVGRNRLLALQKDLKEAKNAALRSTQLKTDFLNMMSHEIRTPLNAIHMFCLLLLSEEPEKFDEDQRSSIEGIQRAAHDLTQQVNDVLDIGKIESGKVSVQTEEFSLQHLFDSLRSLLKPLANNPLVHLVFEPPPEIESIRTDFNKLSHILRNLVTNGLKFTNHGSVALSAERKQDAIIWTVADTGIGIPEESVDRIFDDFYQVENESQRRVKGTGLGLSISRKLAQLLGGTLSVKSALGAGSSFSLSIPVERLGIR
jgi:signal transduction histidine kinase